MGYFLAIGIVVVVEHVMSTSSTWTKKNVIHIVADDLRPELGCYGLPDRHTPNIDALAERGTVISHSHMLTFTHTITQSHTTNQVFDNAYCQQSVCGPSRNSFMTGRYPDRSRTWNFINSFREDHPDDWTTLPGLFKKNGGLALGSGKIFHPKMPPAYDGEKSWSKFNNNLPFHNPCWNTADFKRSKSCEKESPASATCDGGLPCAFCPIDIEARLPFLHVNTNIGNEFCEIDAYEDSLSVDHAISLLREAKKDGRQFYLAVGMHKPHLPWQAAKEDWDHHPKDKIDVASNQVPPINVPPIALHSSDDALHASPYVPVSNESAKSARRAYRSAVTGMDRKLGRLMKELKYLGLENNTAIVLMGDHGWSLGEHGMWHKMTNFEETTRVPLVVSAPWLYTSNSPRRSSAIVELVDVLPTIADLAGLTLPDSETFDGKSFVSVLSGETQKSRTEALSCYPRRVKNMSEMWKGNDVIHTDRTLFTHMGYTIRTHEFRYTEWSTWNSTSLRANLDDVIARELYDHRKIQDYPINFNTPENINVVDDVEYAPVVTELSATLRARVRAQLAPQQPSQ